MDWKNQKILVTGGTGLVGSNVIKVARERYKAEKQALAADLEKLKAIMEA